MKAKAWDVIEDVDMEAQINKIHEIIKTLFSEATSVKVFVNCEGIEVEPSYRTNISGYSMKTITGTWVKKEER